MFTKKRVFFVLMIAALVLLVLAITPFAGAQENKPEAKSLRPGAPTYALHGPYWVGTLDFVIGPETDRPSIQIRCQKRLLTLTTRFSWVVVR